jgi:uncharacterized RDD family membrane protein YckC
MPLLHVKTPFNIDLHFETAQFHRRLFAWIIDLLIIYLYKLVISGLLNVSMSLDTASDIGIETILIGIPAILYHFIFELSMNGQSLGKFLMKIHVVSLSGKTPTASQLLLRWLGRFIDFGMLWGISFMVMGSFFLGSILCVAGITSFIVYLTTATSQRLGDIIAGTTVVSKKLPYNLSDTIFMELDMRSYTPVFTSVMRLSDKDINIIDNIVKHNNQSSIENYLESVAQKIKTVLNIESDMPSDMFLETLLRDYNYLSRK